MSSVPPLAIVPAYLRKPVDLELLLHCLATLRQSAPGADVLVVDDGSPARALAAQLENATGQLGCRLVMKDENSGFARTVNVGLELARAEGRDAVLVNQDIQFCVAGWLDAMLARTDADGRPAAVVGAMLLFPNRLIQHAGVHYSRLNRGWDHRFRLGPCDLPEASAPAVCPVTGALQLIRHATLLEVGVYDEGFDLGWEDVDYCLRVFAAGHVCMYEPKALAIHHESAIRADVDERILAWTDSSRTRLFSKYDATDFAPFAHDAR